MREPGSRNREGAAGAGRGFGRFGRKADRESLGGGAPAPPSPVELAIRYLGPRRRFEREVRAHLRKKGVAVGEIDTALERVRELGLVNDAETAEAWVRDRLRFGPKGRAVLRAQLVRNGVEPAVADAALGAVLAETPEIETAGSLAVKLAARGARAEPAVLRRRLWSALARRGYDAKTVREAVARALGQSGQGEEDGEDL